MKRITQIDLLICLSFVLLVVMLFGKSLTIGADQILSDGDIQRSHYYFYTFVQQAFAKDQIPFWNPSIFSGYPFLANPAVNIFYPGNWLLFLDPLTRGFSWQMALHIYLALVGMYCLLRLFVSPAAALFGALSFGLSGRLTPNLYAGAYDVNTVISLLPWVFFSSIVLLRRLTFLTFFFAVMTIALQILAGYPPLVAFSLQALGLFIVLFSLTKKTFRYLGIFSLVVLFAFGLTAFQWLPRQELITRTIRSYEKPTEWFLTGEILPKTLELFWQPFKQGDVTNYSLNGLGYWEHAVYVGKLPLIIAILAPVLLIIVFYQKKIPKKRGMGSLLILASLLSFIGIWISLGRNASINLFDILNRLLPWYQYFRIPARHLLYTVFGLSLLAGIGFDFIVNLLLPRAFKHIRIVIISIVIGFSFIDLFWFSKTFIVVKPSPPQHQDRELLSYLNRQYISGDKLSRISYQYTPWFFTVKALDYMASMQYGMYSINGYDQLVLTNYYQFLNALNKSPDVFSVDSHAPLINLEANRPDVLNVGYILTLSSYDQIAGARLSGYKRVDSLKSDQFRLYQNERALPRFSIFPNLETNLSRSQIYERIARGQVDLSTTLLTELTNPIQLTCTERIDTAVRVRDYQSNRIWLDIDSPCRGVLFASDVYYPGWKATLDGKSTPLFEVNLAFRGVVIPEGKHELLMYYDSAIWRIGLASALLTSVGLCIIVILVFRKKQ